VYSVLHLTKNPDNQKVPKTKEKNMFVKIKLLRAVPGVPIENTKPKPANHVVKLNTYSGFYQDKKVLNDKLKTSSNTMPNANTSINSLGFHKNFETSKILDKSYEEDNKNNASINMKLDSSLIMNKSGMSDFSKLDQFNTSIDVTASTNKIIAKKLNEETLNEMANSNFRNSSPDITNINNNIKKSPPKYFHIKNRSASLPINKIEAENEIIKLKEISNEDNTGQNNEIVENNEPNNEIDDDEAKEPKRSSPIKIFNSNNHVFKDKSSRQSVFSPKIKLRLSILERNEDARSHSITNIPSPINEQNHNHANTNNALNNSINNISINNTINSNMLNDIINLKNSDVDINDRYRSMNLNYMENNSNGFNSSLIRKYGTNIGIGNLNKTHVLNRKSSLEKMLDYDTRVEEHHKKVPLKKITKRFSATFITAKQNFTDIVKRRESLGVVDPKKINKRYSVSHITSKLGLKF